MSTEIPRVKLRILGTLVALVISMDPKKPTKPGRGFGPVDPPPHPGVLEVFSRKSGFDQPKNGGFCLNQWIGLRENLQETPGNHRFSHEIWGFPVNFPLNQSID
jgi:hypothetical protein